MQYRGDVEIVERDESAHQAVMRARAKEARGQGTANARVQMALSQDGARTHGTIDTDVQLSGRVAAMGRGVIQDVSGKLVDTFAENLAAMLAGPPVEAAAPAAGEPAVGVPPPPPPGAEPKEALPVLPLVGAALAGRLRDPRFLAGTLAAVAAVLVWLGRRHRR